jgi:predicted transcriptional regulator
MNDLTGVELGADGELIELSADIVCAYVSNNALSTTDLTRLIADVHTALKGLHSANSTEPVEELKPAVPVRKSVMPDYIVCLEDGKKFKSLKRHLMTDHGLSPDEYRAKWGLPLDYPMVAPNYSATRSALAKSSGLGRKPAVAEKGAKRKPKA